MARRILALGLSFTLLAAVFMQGAFFGHQFRPIFGLSAVLAATALLDHRRRILLLIALPLLVSTLITAGTNSNYNAAMPTLAGLSLFTFVLITASSLDPKRLHRMLTDAALLTAATAWYGVTFRDPPYGRIAQELWRGSSSITYSNVAAVVIAVGLLIVVEQQRHKPTLANELIIVVLLTGIASTQSRAGALGLCAGLLLLAIATRLNGWSNLLTPTLAGVIAGATVVATSPVANPDRPLLAIAGLAIGLVLTAGLHFMPHLRWAALLITLIVGGAIVAGPAAESRQRITGVRLDMQSADRANEWNAAAELFSDNLLLGVGPGDAPLIWETEGQFFEAEYAHNEYLQLAAEQGLLGVLALIASIGLAIALALRRADAYVIAAIVTLLVHSSFDFLAHVPITLMVLAALIAIPVCAPSSSGDVDLEPAEA